MLKANQWFNNNSVNIYYCYYIYCSVQLDIKLPKVFLIIDIKWSKVFLKMDIKMFYVGYQNVLGWISKLLTMNIVLRPFLEELESKIRKLHGQFFVLFKLIHKFFVFVVIIFFKKKKKNKLFEKFLDSKTFDKFRYP